MSCAFGWNIEEAFHSLFFFAMFLNSSKNAVCGLKLIVYCLRISVFNFLFCTLLSCSQHYSLGLGMIMFEKVFFFLRLRCWFSSCFSIIVCSKLQASCQFEKLCILLLIWSQTLSYLQIRHSRNRCSTTKLWWLFIKFIVYLFPTCKNLI